MPSSLKVGEKKEKEDVKEGVKERAHVSKIT